MWLLPKLAWRNSRKEFESQQGDIMKRIFLKLRNCLSRLSFRTGVIVLLLCIPFYILSFAQFACPIPASAKGVLWVVLFGLAKTFQYGGITILGAEGLRRLKMWFRKSKNKYWKTCKWWRRVVWKQCCIADTSYSYCSCYCYVQAACRLRNGLNMNIIWRCLFM